MRALGYVEGNDLVTEWRSAEGKTERLPGLAAELLLLKVDIIVTIGTPATVAAQKTSTTIPIVMIAVSDPVGAGLIKSLARPGGNITGLTNIQADLGAKQLEMLLSMIPRLSRVAILVNPSNSSHIVLQKNIRAAAQRVGVRLLQAEAQTPQQIENAFSKMAREKPGAIVVGQDASFFQQRRQIAELAAKNRLPSISGFLEYVEAGGLMSYGQSIADICRRAAIHVDKIIKGAKPGDLPVEQPTKFELVVNMKAAKALGIKIPNSILVRADKVIE